MTTIRDFNESLILHYADQAEGFLLSTIDKIEDSPMLENLISQIETYIPSEADANEFIEKLLANVDIDQIQNILQGVEKGVDYADKVIIELMGKIPNATEYLDKIIASRPNLQTIAGDAIERAGDEVSRHLENATNWLNKTSVGLSGGATAGETGLNRFADFLRNGSGSGILSMNERSPSANKTVNNADYRSIMDASTVGSSSLELNTTSSIAGSNTTALPLNGGTMGQSETSVKLGKSDRDEISESPSHNKSKPLSIFDKSMVRNHETNETAFDTFDTDMDRIENTTKTTMGTTNESSNYKGRQRLGPEVTNQSQDHAKEIVENVREQLLGLSENLTKQVDENLEFLGVVGEKTTEGINIIQNVVDDLSEVAENVGELAEDLNLDLTHLGEDTVEEIIANARNLADHTQRAAQRATKDAQAAILNAEELARAAARELDVKAREFAMVGAEKAKEAAEIARNAAASALQHAQVAMEKADDVIKAATKGAIGWARSGLGNLRFYAGEAFKGARIAVKEARKGANTVAKYAGIAKQEILKAYEIAKDIYNKLGVVQIGNDTYCFTTKVEFCTEVGCI